jgi:Protein of unknown function (DUF2911)
MNRVKAIALFATVAILSPLPAWAQRPRLSPHETVFNRIDNALVNITYGRPYSKNARSGEIRKVWGSLVPYGQAWRLGADEATILLTEKPLQFGDTTIPAGAYTLYMVPEENGGKLAFSKKLGGWGIPVDEKQDLARVDLKKEALEKPNEQLAIALDKDPSGGGIIKIMWEGAQYSTPFTVKK